MLQRIAKLLGFNPASTAPRDGFIYSDRGDTVPSDGTAGYGKGCIFQHTDGVSATVFYINQGSATSCDFNAITTASDAGVVVTAQIADDAVTAAKVADGAIDAAAKLASGVVTTAKVLAANITPPKLIGTGIFAGHFVGRNGAGAITLTGAVIGQRVMIGWKSGDASDHNTAGEGSVASLATFVALFETAITVTDQIQQANAGDLTDNKYTVILLPAAA